MEKTRLFLKKIEKTILRFGMIEPGERILVAVSGGADSVCLLHVLHSLAGALRCELSVAHFDHGLRPAEDPEETVFAASLASSLNLACACGEPEVPLSPRTPSLEEQARLARYAFLEKIRSRFGAHRIALAHHMNDQAETVLMRLLRGSGTEGLAGMAPVRSGRFIRPLIEVSRGEIEAYLQMKGLPFMTDSSNRSLDPLRNRVRLELIPLLASFQPRIVERLAATAEILRLDHAFLKQCADKWIEERCGREPGRVRIPRAAFTSLPAGLQNHVIREIVRVVAKGSLRSVDIRHIDAVKAINAAPGSRGPLHLPNGIRAEVDPTHLIVSSQLEVPEECAFSYVLEEPGVCAVPEARTVLTLRLMQGADGVQLDGNPHREYFDADKIRFPLTVRSIRPGDRFRPLGMSGTRKVKNFLIDMKIPRSERRRIPVLTHRSDTEIVWVCGLRIDDRFKWTSGTKRVLEGTYLRQATALEGE
ncbi:tRNA lysidine(34) synthetase TilS [Desulfatiglans anilini]|uniref:tRNA lysidine(34) synthetase TilS n=1 Tax=Desulfatiglans anilini TaxID=90728 RepID=UPI00041639D3|nr:tRNA lysidine(34) synthetase TilS [Desulfatiglans anilini]